MGTISYVQCWWEIQKENYRQGSKRKQEKRTNYQLKKIMYARGTCNMQPMNWQNQTCTEI